MAIRISIDDLVGEITELGSHASSRLTARAQRASPFGSGSVSAALVPVRAKEAAAPLSTASLHMACLFGQSHLFLFTRCSLSLPLIALASLYTRYSSSFRLLGALRSYQRIIRTSWVALCACKRCATLAHNVAGHFSQAARQTDRPLRKTPRLFITEQQSPDDASHTYSLRTGLALLLLLLLSHNNQSPGEKTGTQMHVLISDQATVLPAR